MTKTWYDVLNNTFINTVVCYVYDKPADKKVLRLIWDYDPVNYNSYPFVSGACNWRYAEPVIISTIEVN
jgi:hypothetical protein